MISATDALKMSTQLTISSNFLRVPGRIGEWVYTENKSRPVRLTELQ
jgi:hypothetical protein